MKKHTDGIHTYLLTLLAIGSLLAHAPAYSGDTKQFVDGAHFRLYYKSTTTPVPVCSRASQQAASSPSVVWVGGMRMSVMTRFGV